MRFKPRFKEKLKFGLIYLEDEYLLDLRKHSLPYKLQWLNDNGEVRITKEVLVPFTKGKSHKFMFQEVRPSLGETFHMADLFIFYLARVSPFLARRMMEDQTNNRRMERNLGKKSACWRS